MLLEISQNAQESTCARVSLLIAIASVVNLFHNFDQLTMVVAASFGVSPSFDFMYTKICKRVLTSFKDYVAFTTDNKLLKQGN